jgi:thymidylate kinase
MNPGELVLHLIKDLEYLDIKTVYLRNHENLPESVGNDVDLLISKDNLRKALQRVLETARENGWRVVRQVRFSPISVFLTSDDFKQFLHIDLFDRLEWHSIEYADAGGIMESRRWNGKVYTPDPCDEVFLNVCTRLIYHGKVRDKHRCQTQFLLNQGLQEEIQAAFIRHLGSGIGSALGGVVVGEDWPAAESLKAALRRKVIVRYGLLSPWSALTGICRFLGRSLQRIVQPPGPFIVFEGADGVGKSTVIHGLTHLLKEITGRSDTVLFHWKPTRASTRLAGEASGPASDPRAKSPRATILSILFLAYHWLGFWMGYLRYVLPARVKNRAVVGDRYAFEFILDPARLRLQLPKSLARLAAAFSPQPDLVICQIARPQQVIARKLELSEVEIREYQMRLQNLASGSSRFAILNADGDLDEVLARARALILKNVFRSR